MTTVNVELQQKWLEALRSGKYKQGRHSLRDAFNQFCCLGVLCDLFNPNGWSADGHKDYYHSNGNWAGTFIQDSFLDVIGLTAIQASTLANMNDAGRSFEEIANKIEEYFKENKNANN